MSLTPEELAVRIRADLPLSAEVWLAPELAAMRATLGGHTGESGSDPQLAIVAAKQLAPNGDTVTYSAPPPCRDVIAVVMLEQDPPGAIVARCAGPATVKTRRVLCDLGLLEVAEEGLVVVELAAGTSAAQLQRRVEPTLLISPALQQMVVAKPKEQLANS